MSEQRLRILAVSLAVIVLLAVLAILTTSGTLVSSAAEGPAGIEGADSWTWRGPSHNSASGAAPEVVQIVIDRNTPSIVYATTNQGVYRSSDGGQTWEPRNGGLGGYGDLVVTGLVIDPTNPQALTISTWGYGLFHSTDAGLNWSRLTDPLAAVAAQSTAMDLEPPPVRAGGPSYFYGLDEAAALPEKPLPSGLWPPGGLRGGDEPLEAPEGLPRPLPWTPVRRLAIHPTNPLQLWACIDGGEGLYYSDNGGTSWSHVSLGSGSSRTYTFAPSNSQIRYASFGSWDTSGGFFRTTNGGTNWTQVGVGTINGTVTAVAIHPTDPNYVLAATSGDGLYRSTNGGDGWTKVSTGLADTTFFSVAFAANDPMPTIAYAGGYSWVYRSSDTGATWANADAGFPTYYVEGLAIHPTTSTTVLVGANFFPFGGVYRRTSDGASFAMQPTGMTDTFVLDLEKDPNDPDVLYAATWGGGVFRSDNGGTTWNSRYAVPYIYCLEATQGPTGTILYAGTFYTDWGVLKSYNRGDSWREVSSGYWSDISFDIKSLDGGPTSLVAATYHGVQISGNGGVSWSNVSGLNDGVVLKIARSPGKLLAATWGGGVWASTNGGGNWTESSTGLGGTAYVYDVAFTPGDSTIAYAASNGVYRSSSSGTSWSLSGVSGTWVRALDATAGPYNDVFAGTHDRGVYMAPGGASWWFGINAGLGELRIRSVRAVAADRLFTGTNGRGAWDYTLVHRPEPGVRLPLVMRCWPLPVAPTLYSISNPDGDGSYTVSWSSSPGATSYTLQEDDNASFSSPTTVYSGSATSKAFTGKPAGTYYYRVNASGACGSSSWSNTQSVTVSGGGWMTIKSENFEGTFPGAWQLSDNDSTNGYYYWGKRTCRPYQGSYSGWAVGGGDGAGMSCGSNYPTYVVAWMVYGPFSLADASDAELTFQLWLNSELDYDGVFRGASINGTNYYGYTTTGNTGGWMFKDLDLTAVPTLGDLRGYSNVWIALVFVSDGSITYPEGAYVDDILLHKYVGLGSASGEEALPPLPATAHEEEAVFSREP